MLHDFSFRTPEELLAGLTKSDGGGGAMAKSGMRADMTMGAGSMGGSRMGAMSMGSGMAMDLNDIDYDAFLANDRTLADPEVIRTEPGGRVLLRLINGASATQLWIDCPHSRRCWRRGVRTGKRASCLPARWRPRGGGIARWPDSFARCAAKPNTRFRRAR